MSKKKSEVSVVIVDYRAKVMLKELIQSIEKMSECVYEIVIIDNNPQELKLEINKGIKTRIIRPGENTGFTKGNNLGFQATSGDFVLFLNPDMLFLNDVAGILLGKICSDTEIGAIGPKFLNPDGSHQKSTRRFPSVRSALSMFMPFGRIIFKNARNLYYDHTGAEDTERRVDTISTGAFMVRRSLFQELGGFDENTFMYGEDAELCKRIRDYGLGVVYYPNAELLHYGGQSSKLATEIAVRAYYHSFYYLFKKHILGKWMVVFKPFFWLLPNIHMLGMKFKKDKRIAWGRK